MIITQTPLRISLTGGGTDLPSYYSHHGGEVVSAAIDKYMYVVLKKRFDQRIRVGYSKTEIVNAREDLKHELAREAMRTCNTRNGIEIATLSDAPSGGTGLGTSSSVTVGMLNALYHYQFNPQSPETLAREAVNIEVDKLKKPIGKQDQYIAAYGGLCHVEFHKDGTVSVRRLEISPQAKRELESHLMLLYTGIERSANPILKDLVRNMASRAKLLSGIKALVPRMCGALGDGNMKEVGEVLNENWRLKRKYANGTTNGELDSLYTRLLEAGAYGAKLSGAGGGGFFLVCCAPERQNHVREALGSPKALYVRIERDGSRVIFNIRRD